jgi:HlyD family secretion protein
MSKTNLEQMRIDPEAKRRPSRVMGLIFTTVAVITLVALILARPWAKEEQRLRPGATATAASNTNAIRAAAPAPQPARVVSTNAPTAAEGEKLLTVSGYIVNRERIELSPRYLGVVRWIGVKKGDSVTNGQVVVLLDDAEYKARLQEVDGRLAVGRIAVEKAELDYQRVLSLATDRIESPQARDHARLAVEAAKASVQEIEGQRQLLKTYLDWTVIRSPIDGVVLEKLVDPNELVTPQSFGGTRGPSTALIAVADPKDLQVEIDLNEADVSKAFLGQRCRVSPEAYPDKVYEGYVAEMAPEANRQKGTLQIKVQIVDPDRFLTPELSAKVDFLPEKAPMKR